MRYQAAALTILLSIICGCAPYYSGEQPAGVTVSDSTAVTKHQAHLRAREWVAINFRSAQNAIQYSDTAIGKIILRGDTHVYMIGVPIRVSFLADVSLSDGMVSTVYSQYQAYDGRHRPAPMNKFLLQKMNDRCTEMGRQLIDYIEQSSDIR